MRRKNKGIFPLLQALFLLLLGFYWISADSLERVAKFLLDVFFVLIIAVGLFFLIYLGLKKATDTKPKIIVTQKDTPKPKDHFSGNQKLFKRDMDLLVKIGKPNTSSSMPIAWSSALLRSLDWRRFEELCAAYFQMKGQNAQMTNYGADGGIDILLYSKSKPEQVFGVMQCKAWTTKPVGVKEIRELFGVMNHVGCTLGVYLTTSIYTEEARKFSEGKRIQLLTSEDLLTLIKKLEPPIQEELLAIATKGDYTTPTCPSCGIKLTLRTNTRSKNQFWGCRNFPRCRCTMQVRA